MLEQLGTHANKQNKTIMHRPAVAQAPWALAPRWAEEVRGPITPAPGFEHCTQNQTCMLWLDHLHNQLAYCTLKTKAASCMRFWLITMKVHEVLVVHHTLPLNR
jgi:hypothetical protein